MAGIHGHYGIGIKVEYLLSCDGLSKSYSPDVKAVVDVSIILERGRYVGLIGPNGAGKSTLLNVLGGLLKPTTGSVSLNAMSVGWCPQQTVVDWSLTVLENVMLPARLLGMSAKQSRKLATESLRLLGLEASAGTTAETLSGGQLQRVQIARALATEPELVLLDEPTTGLDVEGQEALWGEMRRRRQKGVGGIISSHDLDALERECDSFIFMRSGRVITQLSRDDLDSEEFSVFEVRAKDSEGQQHLIDLAARLGRGLNLDSTLWLRESELEPSLDGARFVLERRKLSLRAAYKTVGFEVAS